MELTTHDLHRELVLIARDEKFPEETRIAARNDLIISLYPLARRYALRASRSGEHADDLTQAAILGLYRAIDKFDVTRADVKFSSFAVGAIRFAIRSAIRGRKMFNEIDLDSIVDREREDPVISREKRDVLRKVMDSLSDCEYDSVCGFCVGIRRNDGSYRRVTDADIAKHYGITIGLLRHIRASAIRKIRDAVESVA